MTDLQTQRITKNELQYSRRSVVIHDLSEQLDIKKIKKIVEKQIGSSIPDIQFGQTYKVDGEERRRVFINFNNEDDVNRLMKNRPFLLDGKQLVVSRHIPKKCPLFGQMTCALSITICETKCADEFAKKAIEYDLQKYLEKFGEIVCGRWENDNELILQFKDYDSVDQIILTSLSHTIANITFHVKKTLPIQTHGLSTSNSHLPCVHVTNLPVDVTSEELAAVFHVHVANILLRPAGYPLATCRTSSHQMNSEAWIKRVGNEQEAKALVAKTPGAKIRGFAIRQEVVDGPYDIAELCRDLETGTCRYSFEQCHYKHIMCDQPDICDDDKCWYGHHQKRQTRSIRRPAKDLNKSFYRARISNLPLTVTKEELQKRLKINLNKDPSCLVLSKNSNSTSMIAYIINQPSENYIRRKIYEWHDKPFAKEMSKKMKCQLEMNMDFFDWDDLSEIMSRTRASSSVSSAVSETHSTTTKYAPWYNAKKESSSLIPLQTAQSNDKDYEREEITRKRNLDNDKSITDIREPDDMAQLAPDWSWTNERLSNDQADTRVVYLLVKKNDKKIKAAIKIYLTRSNPMARLYAQYERIALEKLIELEGVPKFIASNINPTNGCAANNPPWIIMEHIEGISLYELMKNESTSLYHKVKMTFNLLNIVKQMHSQHIIHRNINPENIMVKMESTTQFCSDKMNLVLISFGLASLINEDHQPNKQNSMDVIQHMSNQSERIFYRDPQLEKPLATDSVEKNEQMKLCHSPTIDTNHLGAILFWFITKHYPRESKDIHGQAPHELKNHIRLIQEELTKVTGIWTDREEYAPLERHLNLIFDRSFGDHPQQWPIEELSYEFRHLLELIMPNTSCFSLPIREEQQELISYNSKSESFVQLTSLIDWIKRNFEVRYPNVHWLSNEKSGWSGCNQRIENQDILTFQKQQWSSERQIIWRAKINKNRELKMDIIVMKINPITNVQLPIGIWKDYQHDKVKEEILQSFELEMKICIDILYQDRNM